VTTKPANLARAIYGYILATSLVAAFSEDDDYSTTEVAVSVFVTGLVFWLAHVYASLLGERYAAGRRLTRSEMGAEFYAEWPLVQAFIPSIAVLLLGTIGLLSDDTAVWLAIASAWPPCCYGVSRSVAASACLHWSSPEWGSSTACSARRSSY
jgi:hypothetical protein